MPIRPKAPSFSWDLVAICFFVFALYGWYQGWPETQIEGLSDFDQGGLVQSTDLGRFVESAVQAGLAES